MNQSLHIVCPRCDSINRVPRAKLTAGGRCRACREPLFEGRPLALDGARFARHLEKSDIPVLIDFWAPWFAPCRAVAPAKPAGQDIAGDAAAIADQGAVDELA